MAKKSKNMGAWKIVGGVLAAIVIVVVLVIASDGGERFQGKLVLERKPATTIVFQNGRSNSELDNGDVVLLDWYMSSSEKTGVTKQIAVRSTAPPNVTLSNFNLTKNGIPLSTVDITTLQGKSLMGSGAFQVQNALILLQWNNEGEKISQVEKISQKAHYELKAKAYNVLAGDQIVTSLSNEDEPNGPLSSYELVRYSGDRRFGFYNNNKQLIEAYFVFSDGRYWFNGATTPGLGEIRNTATKPLDIQNTRPCLIDPRMCDS